MTPYYTDSSVTLHHCDALHLPLPDSSVDLICTSPPYFGLRSYQDGGEHYAGQIGSEATPAEFVDALIAATAEMVRVLKPSGSIWVNLGDRYSGASGGASGLTALGKRLGTGGGQKQGSARTARPTAVGFRPKSLIGVPWRYAIRCIDDLGLILRAEVIWSKPNGLPESVTDRVRRSHETWFHFTKMPRYFSAVDEIREPLVYPADGDRARAGKRALGVIDGQSAAGNTSGSNPLGKLPGSVWTIPTHPLTVPANLGIDHFAAFPMEWPRRIIRGWSPAGVCVACGEGRRPVSKSALIDGHAWAQSQHFDRMCDPTPQRRTPSGLGYSADDRARSITGYACDCSDSVHLLKTRGGSACGSAGESDADIESVTCGRCILLHDGLPVDQPGVVLDPFGGTGTTALVAKVLGRHGISVDMSADYCRLAEWRINDPDQIASAMQVEKPAKQVEGQWDLFTPVDFGGVA